MEAQPSDSDTGRVGPNAIIRVAEAVRDRFGVAKEHEFLRSAGIAAYAEQLPQNMVDEREVGWLQRAVFAGLELPQARLVMKDAGHRTGDYLLAHRIPGPVQRILRILPAPLASRLLLAAIKRNAWTFAGSGHLDASRGRPVQLSLAGCPLCRDAASEAPVCDYYAATFERLFRELVSARSVVTETRCQALGAATCVFEVRW